MKVDIKLLVVAFHAVAILDFCAKVKLIVQCLKQLWDMCLYIYIEASANSQCAV